MGRGRMRCALREGSLGAGWGRAAGGVPEAQMESSRSLALLFPVGGPLQSPWFKCRVKRDSVFPREVPDGWCLEK